MYLDSKKKNVAKGGAFPVSKSVEIESNVQGVRQLSFGKCISSFIIWTNREKEREGEWASSAHCFENFILIRYNWIQNSFVK